MSYSNWGSHHSKIELAAFVPATLIVETLDSCLDESYSTMEGRDTIRNYLKMPTIKVNRAKRFPEPGIQININNMKVSNILHNLYKVLDTDEPLYETKETRLRSYYDNMMALRQVVTEVGYDAPAGDGYSLPSFLWSGIGFFDRAHFEKEFKLQWKP